MAQLLHFGALGPDGRAALTLPDLVPVVGEDVPQGLAAEPALAGDHAAVRGDGHIAEAGAAAGHQGQAQGAQRLLLQPAGAGEVQFHFQLLCHRHGLCQYVGELLLGQRRGPALVAHRAAGGDQPGAGHVADAQTVDETQHLVIGGIQAAQGRVHGHGQPRRHSGTDTRHGVIKAVGTHQGVVNVLIMAVERHLHTVQAGVIQLLAQHGRQQAAVGVQPGDKPLGGVHQLHQIGAQGGLAAGERHLGDICRAQPIQDLLPLGGGQLRHIGQGLSRRIAVQTFLVAVPRAVTGHGADHQVHTVGRGHLGGVLAQRQRRDLRLRRLPPGDGHQGLYHDLQVLRQTLPGREGVDLMGLGHRTGGHGVPVALGDLQPGEGLQPVHEAGEQDGPAQVQGHQLAAVEQQQKGRVFRVLTGWDHVDTHHAPALGVQGDVPHTVQVLPPVAALQHCRHRQSSFMKAMWG